MNSLSKNRTVQWLFLCLTWLASPGMAGNTISIGGSGSSKVNIDASTATESVIDLYQVSSTLPGLENQAGTDVQPIVQSGAGQVARIGQGATWNGSTWVPGAPVEDDVAVIRQYGLGGDTALIVQTSSDNSATIIQHGPAALATINQGGLGGHIASIETLMTYIGAGVTVTQTGFNNQAYVVDMTGGSATIDQSGTGGYVSLVNQSAGQLGISQQGTNNGLTIENYGLGAALSITQTGAGGAATTFNPDPPPVGPTYVY